MLIVGLTTSILLCFSPSATAQGNLVENGGFDTDASGWMLTNGARYNGLYGNPAGDLALGGGPSSIPTASQEINGLISGQLYTVSGDYLGGGGVKNTSTGGFGVALDGVFLFETNAPTDSGWYGFSFDYTATSTNALLSLSAQINGTVFSYSIDNITMYTVPEPSSTALIVLGSGVLFYVRRKWTEK